MSETGWASVFAQPPGGDLTAAIRKLALAQMDCAYALMLAVKMIQGGTHAEADEATRVAAQAFEQAKEAFDRVTR